MAFYREVDGDIVRDYALERCELLHIQTDRACLEVVPTRAFGRVLFLDNQMQLAERDEYIYHEMLVHPCLSLCQTRRTVCILGGGDGCAAREVLRWPDVDSVTVIDWDKDLTDLFRFVLSDINKDSFRNPRVHIENEDIFALGKQMRSYDCILVDLIDLDYEQPEQADLFFAALHLVKQWCVESGSFVFNLGGILPWETARIQWALQTARSNLSMSLQVYKVFVPSFAREWCFLIGSNTKEPSSEFPEGLRYASPELFASACRWSKPWPLPELNDHLVPPRTAPQ